MSEKKPAMAYIAELIERVDNIENTFTKTSDETSSIPQAIEELKKRLERLESLFNQKLLE